MKILAVMFKVFLLSLGLVMIAGGLFCSAIGLESSSYGIVAVIGAASAVLGALFFYLAIRGLNRKQAAAAPAPGETPQP